MIEKLGAGGMATVWKARQVSLDRIVAIKILSARLASDPEDIKRFQTEAQAAAKLKHPGIIQVYDANVEKGTYYFVMEYVAGYTVGDWVRRKGRLPEQDALLVAQCVADALEYAWDREHIIHCDIKPDNIIVDSDGAVKIADLGLSRTISQMAGQAVSDEVLGTPAYLSPEQAMGRQDLDCGADIYSLGAMLYHLLTGEMLFEGKSDEEIMEGQVSGTVPDPLSLNPQLSQSVCWLVEKLLVKSRDKRYSDWGAVKSDIEKTKKKLPVPGRPPVGASTVSRSKARTGAKRARAGVASVGAKEKGEQHQQPKPGGLPGSAIAALVVGGVVLVAILVALLTRGSGPSQPPVMVRPPVRPQPAGPRQSVEDVRERQIRDAYDRAVKWAADHPEDYDESIRGFKRVLMKAGATKYGRMAESRINELTVARDAAARNVMGFLATKTEYQVQRQKYGEAATIYERYDGKLAAATRGQRMAMVMKYRREQKKIDDERSKLAALGAQKLEKFYDEIALKLTADGVAEAQKAIIGARQDPALASKEREILVVKQLLDDAAGVNVRIMNSFKRHQGKEILVGLTGGKQQVVTIVGVRDDSISATRRIGRANVKTSFTVDDLSIGERLQRMGQDADPGVALVKGLMALESRAYTRAREYFEKVNPVLSVRLVARVNAIEQQRAALLAPKPPPAPAVAAAPEKDEDVPIVRPKPAGPAAPKAVVLERLLDFNPELQPEEIRLVEAEGEVRRAEMLSPGVRSISPLAQLTALHRVSCGARHEPASRLTDLSPLAKLPLEALSVTFSPVSTLVALKNLQLEELCVRGCPISDISVVRRMPLKKLNISRTRVRDLTLLRGMKLEELNCSDSRVTDIRPLSSMQLKSLNISGCSVRDLMWIKGMPLTSLDVSRTKTHSFGSIRGMSLTLFSAADTQFRDAGLLEGMPLRHLDLRDTGVKDIRPLAGMPLERLVLAGTTVRDFSPLANMALKHVVLSGCHISDLTPLVGAPLAHLDISHTSVSDLTTISRRQLNHLNINSTRVADLTPIVKAPLTWLDCRRIRTTNLLPLRRSNIVHLWVDRPDDMILRTMPKLATVNGQAWQRWAGERPAPRRGR